MAITNARMQHKRGEEFNFDPDKMLPGEWAVSLDTKYVRMCFSPGVCVRMATYEAFEADMAQITAILEEAKTVQEAVEKINLEISDKLNAVIEYSEQTKQYRDEAEQFRNEAFSATPDGYEKLVTNVTENTVKIDTIIEKAELNIKNTASGENIHLTDSANSKVVEFGLYGKATQDGEPTPDNPIEITVSGSDGSVGVVSCGKNLLENTATSKTVYGVTYTVNDDGSVTANGTATGSDCIFEMYKQNTLEFLRPNQYIVSGCPQGGSINTYEFYIYDVTDSKYVVRNVGSVGVSFTYIENHLYNVGIVVRSGTTVNNLVFKPMIRLASITDSTYEPYKGQTLSLSTPNGLAGIPVDSGGNYTDSDGQQWLCDEIVKYADGSGKRIQRVGKDVLSTSNFVTFSTSHSKYNQAQFDTDQVFDIDNFRSRVLKTVSNKFVYGQDVIGGCCMRTVGNNGWNGKGRLCFYVDKSITDIDSFMEYVGTDCEAYYALAEPIITDLTAEEIAEIEKLHTFYPITNISNDADCGMKLAYIADSKNYIDGQLAIQKDQQEEALATMLLLMPEEVQASMIENDTNNLLNESEV